MVELSTSRVFDVSDPVEALEYDLPQCRLIVSSQHGNYALYDVGKNGNFQLSSFYPANFCGVQGLWFASGRQLLIVIRLLILPRVCGSMKVVGRFLSLFLNLAKCE